MSESFVQNSSSPSCKRCGTCCRNGGPALHIEDRQLIENGMLSFEHFVTVRENEPAFNQRTSTLDTDTGEFLKIGGSSGSWCCRFWNREESSCGIYGDRPLECRLLFCEDTRAVEDVMGRNLLTRESVIGTDHELMEPIRHHESLCCYKELNTLVAGFLDDPSDTGKLHGITRLVNKDLAFRNGFFVKNRGLVHIEMFLYGRPYFLVLAPYGFKAVETPRGLIVQYVHGSEGDAAIASC